MTGALRSMLAASRAFQLTKMLAPLTSRRNSITSPNPTPSNRTSGSLRSSWAWTARSSRFSPRSVATVWSRTALMSGQSAG